MAAAAEEAVTLAKAALKSAKEAAMMVKSMSSSKPRTALEVSPKVNWSLSKQAELRELDQAHLGRDLDCRLFLGRGLGHESNELEPTSGELEDLQEELSRDISVRSHRQTERKARRVRAAEKSAANVVYVKTGSTSRKKRASLQDIDYSDPLRYLRGTTSSSRLLTASEELELSAGIQVNKQHHCEDEFLGGCNWKLSPKLT